jgi:2'-5' RNA ligase
MFAVVLYFDPESEEYILNLQKAISRETGNSRILDAGIPPHISLTIVSARCNDCFIQAVDEFARTLTQGEIMFPSIGIFNTDPAVLYLAPVADENLRKMNKELYLKLQPLNAEFDPFYAPGMWVPHCSLGYRLEKSELIKATEIICHEFKPFQARIVRAAIACCEPFREYRRWNISK